MKLNQTTLKYTLVSSFAILIIWSVIFYYNLMDEIYDSIDDGLSNFKILIIQECEKDSSALYKLNFDESNYAIREVSKEHAMLITDTFKDTLMYMEYEEDFEPVRMLTTAFYQSDKYYELKVISSMIEKDDLVNNLFWSVLILFFILLISLTMINSVVLKAVWRPFYELLEKLRVYSIENEMKPPEIETNITEFQQLNQSISTLINNSKKSFENQKRFTENAAHELQTPITGIIHRLQLLLDEGNLTKKDANSINNALDSAGRMARLNKDLLLLTKIENFQFKEAEKVDIEQIFRVGVEDLVDFASFRNIDFRFTIEDIFEIEMNRSLSQILVNNLLKNAIVHGDGGKIIEIVIEANRFSVCNQSPGTPLDKYKIFDRFYKGSDSSVHSGLGLTLVKAICDSYLLEINYQYKEGHIFTVSKKI